MVSGLPDCPNLEQLKSNPDPTEDAYRWDYIGIVDANSQDNIEYRKDRNGFSLYGGLNWKYIKGDRLVIPDPKVPDQAQPNYDSILLYDCLSPHIGSHYNIEIIKSLNLRVGLELNLRKYHHRLYPDSISKVYYPAF